MNSNNDTSQGSIGNSAYAIELTAVKFLGKDGRPGYETSEELLAHYDSLTPADRAGLSHCIEYAGQGLRCDGGREIRKDVAGRQYQYYRFFKPKSQPGAKVVLTPGIVRFLSDYQNGLINVCFTLDDLIAEARKQPSIQQTNS